MGDAESPPTRRRLIQPDLSSFAAAMVELQQTMAGLGSAGLVDMLNSEDAPSRCAALLALSVEPNARRFVPTLKQQMLRDSELEIQAIACCLLHLLGEPALRLGHLCTRFLGSSDEVQRAWACARMIEFGGPHELVTPSTLPSEQAHREAIPIHLDAKWICTGMMSSADTRQVAQSMHGQGSPPRMLARAKLSRAQSASSLPSLAEDDEGERDAGLKEEVGRRLGASNEQARRANLAALIGREIKVREAVTLNDPLCVDSAKRGVLHAMHSAPLGQRASRMDASLTKLRAARSRPLSGARPASPNGRSSYVSAAPCERRCEEPHLRRSWKLVPS